MQEKINNILAQETLNESDIKVVMAHVDLLSEIQKARLGLIPVWEAEAVETPEELPLEIPKKRKTIKK